MSRRANNWKNAEKYGRDLYLKYKIPATRETRADDYSVSDFEIKVDNHPEIVTDSKYSEARPYRHHALILEAEDKYCKDKGDIAVILTKNFSKSGGCITVRDQAFAMLLSYWLGYGTKEELLEIYKSRRSCDL